MSPSAEEQLIDAAVRARENAYAPYSGFRVGAAILLANGDIHVGVNVENCSYPLSVCAERNAVAAAVVQGAVPGDVVAVSIVAEAHGPPPPCGACRQVLVELARNDAIVLMHNLADGATTRVALGDLLPHAFARDNMPRS